MFEYISGKYKGTNGEYIIIDNNGLGYKIFTSGNTMADMPKIDEYVTIYIEQIVREDFIGLYGFLTKQELELFKQLIRINGVGAKATLSLLSISSSEKLKFAIVSQDEKSLIKAPGIGKKIAQRIILELRDKIDLEGTDAKHGFGTNESIELDEAALALLSLGYGEKEVKVAIDKFIKDDHDDNSLENIIKMSLKYLMK